MQYNELIYNSGPTNIKDYVSDRYNIVHNQLYVDALNNYIYDKAKIIVMKNILYNLFLAMNNCITELNDAEEYPNNIINFNNINNRDKYDIIPFAEINNIINDIYSKKIINYINNSSFCEEFNDAFKSLSIYNEQLNYINYIIVNVILLMEDIKTDISKIQDLKNNPRVNNFSDFIIRYKNSLYMVDEESGLTLFTTEISDNEIFIYEEQYKSDFHIGFNKDGYFILDIDQNIDISNFYDKLYYIIGHINNLLLNLLLNYIIEAYLKNNTIIERANTEYYLPSSIIIYEKQYPHKKTIIDLSPYWSNYNDNSNINIEDIKIKNESINDSQIKDINYVNGTIKVYSKMHDIEYTVNNKFIHADTQIDDDLIKNMFINQNLNI